MENTQVVFLMETRLHDSEMHKIKVRCGFSSYFSVACNGSDRHRAGGLALLWHDQVNITVKSFSLNHILCMCEEGEGNDPWFLSGIYGFPKEHNKKKTWQLIQQLSSMVGSKWICLGDLNDILMGVRKREAT